MTKFEYIPLVTKSLSLMIRHFSQRTDMAANMMNTQCVIYPEVAALMDTIKFASSEIRRNMKWISSPDAVLRVEAFAVMFGAVKTLSELLTVGSAIEVGQLRVTITSVVEKLQSMMRLLGVHQQVLALLQLSLPQYHRFTNDRLDEIWDRELLIEHAQSPFSQRAAVDQLSVYWDRELPVDNEASSPPLPIIMDQLKHLFMEMQRSMATEVVSWTPQLEARVTVLAITTSDRNRFIDFFKETVSLPLPELLSSAYAFLGRFCSGHKTNQPILFQDLPLFLSQISCVRTGSFFKSLFDNNKALNKSVPEALVKAAVEKLFEVYRSGAQTECGWFRQVQTRSVSEVCDAIEFSKFLLEVSLCDGRRNIEASKIVISEIIAYQNGALTIPSKAQMVSFTPPSPHQVMQQTPTEFNVNAHLFMSICEACSIACRGVASVNEIKAQSLLPYDKVNDALVRLKHETSAHGQQNSVLFAPDEADTRTHQTSLRMLTVLLKFFHEVYVVCGVQVTLRRVSIGDRILWTASNQEEIDDELRDPRTVMSICTTKLAETAAMCREQGLHWDELSITMVWDAILPLVCSFYKDFSTAPRYQVCTDALKQELNHLVDAIQKMP